MTKKKETYWNSLGKYQEKYELKSDEMIPTSGMSKTIKGELLRCASRLYYDVYNNGLCNDKTYEIEFIRNYFSFKVEISLLDRANESDGYGVDFAKPTAKIEKELEDLMDKVLEEL